MKFKILKRKSKCDKNTYFYDLYVNGIWLCGFYDKRVIKVRKEMYKKRIMISDYYSTRKLCEKYHLTKRRKVIKWN